jgi:hypothetical protein
MLLSSDCLAARRCPYCSHGDLHGIGTMTQRSERWLTVGACVVLYAIAMALVVWAIREPTRWIVSTLDDTLGPYWSWLVIVLPVLALLAFATLRERKLPPVEFTPPRGPRWARYLGNAYLALLGISVVIVIGAIFRAG